jgi:tetratricopeptide (TPR) repeat protein
MHILIRNKKALIGVLFFVLTIPALSQQERLIQAHYKAYCQDTGIIIRQADIQTYPYAVYVENLQEFLPVFINENPDDLEKYLSHFKDRKKRILEMKEGEMQRFALAEMYFHTSLAHLKFGNYTSAAHLLRKSYDLHETNYNKNPKFKGSYKTLSIIDLVAGQVPSQFQWAVHLVGIKADEKRASRLLKRLWKEEGVTFNGNVAREASYLYGMYRSAFLGEAGLALDELERYYSDNRVNLSSAFFKANLAQHAHRNDEVIRVIESAPKVGKNTIPTLELMLGEAYLNKLDKRAEVHIKKYIRTYQGAHYIKDAYRKLSWHYYVQGDKISGFSYQKKIQKVGKASTELDQQAEEYSKQIMPHPTLLKARLLFDGGYYERARNLMKYEQVSNFETSLYKTEYCYRKGRIYFELQDTTLSRMYFQAAIPLGKDLSVYYASYSALYLGEIYLLQGKKKQAETYFRMARSFSANREYRNSIEIKSKAGEKRCK